MGESLSRRLGLEYVSVRDLIEGVALTNTSLGLEIKLLGETGAKPPAALVERLVLERLRERDCADKVSLSDIRWLLLIWS